MEDMEYYPKNRKNVSQFVNDKETTADQNE